MSFLHGRPLQPLQPTPSLYLAQIWDLEVFRGHRKKVFDAKPYVDNAPPKVHMHLHIKLKKLQNEAERLATVERDNRVLLLKMAQIMRREEREPLFTGANISLNRVARKRALLRITQENMSLLKRLDSKDTYYSNNKMEKEYEKTRKIMLNVSKYARMESNYHYDVRSKPLASPGGGKDFYRKAGTSFSDGSGFMLPGLHGRRFKDAFNQTSSTLFK